MGKLIEITRNDNMIKDIITDYDKLSERCDEFDLTKKNTEVQEIVLSLKQTIRNDESISALSANQIGYNKRILCINFNGNIRSFINPVITNVSGFELSREKCHSIPGKEFIRPRHNKITVTYQTPLAKIETVQLMGMAARLFQHHVDHLDGLLLSDVGLEIDDQFDTASKDEQEQIIDMYLDAIDLNKDQIDAAIDSDPEAKKLADGVRFINNVKSGKTKIENIYWTDEEKKVFEEYIASQPSNSENEV